MNNNNSVILKNVYLFLLLILSLSASSQKLLRQARIDYSIGLTEEDKYPIYIKEIPESSSFYKAGLRKGDQLISINKTPITNLLNYQRLSRKWRAGIKVTITLNRKGIQQEINCLPEARPIEKFENAILNYDNATSKNGYDVRLLVTRPANSKVKKPVLFFIQWLSCDQVEINRNNMDGWAKLIDDLVSKTGYVVIRTEKPGLGDSNGPDCSECDLVNEINAYKASFQKMLDYDFIDKNNIFIVGGSIGGALAPIIAEDQPIKGIISTGGFSTTWFEHILDFERSRLFFSGTKPDTIDYMIKKFTSFYYQYLVQKKRPTDIIKTDRSFQKIWYQEGDIQFDRPAMYYQQLQDLNMSYYWGKINCPVLVVYGEYDWIMTRAEQDNILQLLNSKKPNLAELRIIPGMNHHFAKFNTAQEAFDEPYNKYEPIAFEIMKEWLDKRISNPH